ncbi:MAG: hypothetical protein QXF21_06640, partial [Thermoproteota archaeon]
MEPRSVSDYLAVVRIVDGDLRRLTGRGLDEAGPEDLRACLADYGGRLKDSSRVFYVIAARKYLLDFRGRVEFAEVLKVRRSGKRGLPRFLREEEVKRLIEGAGNLRDRLIVELLWETGCRPGELLN